MTARELEDVAIEWAAQEGWNPGLNDAPVFFNTDPDGFFIGLVDNEPVACISAVAYDKVFGFIGFYIVKPGYRKEGYSLKLCRKALQHLGDRNIGIDGVVEQQENYLKMGFGIAYNNIRFQGKTFSYSNDFKKVIPVNQVNIDDLIKFDAAFFPVPRPDFLKKWISMPLSDTLVASTNGKIDGYGTIRRCRKGYKIGPLFANTYQTAHDLLCTLLGTVQPYELFYLDIPDINNNARLLVKQLGMVKVFETARMYSNSSPDIDLDKIYGITSFELG
jgi:hypothetical protein